VKRARVKEAALAVLLREGFDAKTAERLADKIAHEPIPIAVKPKVADKLERALERATEPH
jgi:hypothetical protein